MNEVLSLNTTRLVSFDLDDTLIRGIHSVLLPCILNGKGKECRAIDDMEAAGELDYISADYLKAELFEGLPVTRIAESFLDIARPLDGIKNVVDALHQKDILCIVVTVGPIQVAKTVCDIYGFDDCCGKSIAINASAGVQSKATYAIDTQNLMDILCFI